MASWVDARALARGDMLRDVRGRPAAAQPGAPAGPPHGAQSDKVDAGHRGYALALIRRAVRSERARYANPREVLAVARGPDHGLDARGREIELVGRHGDFAVAPVALELRFGDVLAAPAREVADAHDERARLMVARPHQRLEITRKRDARAIETDEPAGEPRARLPHGTHVEVALAPAREERERIVGLGLIRVGDDRTVVAIVPAPPHLITTVDASRHPAVLADRHGHPTPRVREFVRDLESRPSWTAHEHAAGWQILRRPIVV